MIITLIEPRSVDIIKAFETFWFTTAIPCIEACPTPRVVPDLKLEYFEANIEGVGCDISVYGREAAETPIWDAEYESVVPRVEYDVVEDDWREAEFALSYPQKSWEDYSNLM
jgi:hypothetical protein